MIKCTFVVVSKLVMVAQVCLMVYCVWTATCNTVTEYKVPKDYASAGCTLAFLHDNLAISVGGTSQSMFILTRVIVPVDECSATPCNIDKTDVNPVLWLYCDMCHKWLHIVCIGLSELPKSDIYYCPSCSGLPGSTGGKRRGRV